MRHMLRRHGKIIMTILGVVLMIVFTLPAFQSQGRDSSGDTVGKLNGTRIRNRDIAFAAFELDLIKSFNRDFLLSELELDERNPPTHWMLLVKEAEKYGFNATMPTFEDIQNALAQGYPPFIPSYTPEDIQTKLIQSNAGQKDLVNAFAHLAMVQQLRGFATTLPQPVSAIELLADQQLTKVSVAYATLDAVKAAASASLPAPSDAQVQKQFDLYKGVVHTRIPTNPNAPLPPMPPLIDGHRYPFGYKYPDRVKVEYLVFDRAKIRENIKVTQEDYDLAFKYWTEHQDEFRNPAPTATQPAVRGYDEVKADLVNRQVDARTNRLIARMVERIRAQAADPWKSAVIDLKGFKETVPADKWASYEKLAEDLAKNRDFQGFKPEYKALTDKWLDAEALESLPGIGAAVYRPSDRGEELSFPRLATHVKELGEVSARDAVGRLFLQKGTEGPTLQDAQRNVYIYRVVDAAPSAEPKAVDEVRPQVLEDLKLLASYEQQKQAAEELARAAQSAELAALASQKNLPVETTPEFSRLDTELPEAVQRISGFVEAAFKLVPARASATQPAATQPSGIGAATTLHNDNTLRAYTLEVLNISPAKASDFALRRRELMQYADPSLMAYARSWFTLDALAQRLNYVPLTPFPPAKKDDETEQI